MDNNLFNFNPDTLMAFHREISVLKDEMGDSKLDLSNALKSMEEASFDRKVYKQAAAIGLMDASKGQQYITDLLQYCLALGVFDQMDLLQSGEPRQNIEGFIWAMNNAPKDPDDMDSEAA